MNEEWRDIRGYERLYQVSNQGRVRSLPRKRRQATRGGTVTTHFYDGKILTLQKARAGYFCAHLSNGEKARNLFVHRLVADAFIEKPEGCDIVNHIDCNPANNAASNLEWTTYKGNMQHASRLGRMGWQPENQKKAVNALKRPVIAIKDGRERRFESESEAYRALGIKSRHIAEACRKQYKTCGGYEWRYAQEREAAQDERCG